MTDSDKRTLLLDKNVFLHAIHCVDRFNNEDYTALKLLNDIAHQCDVIMLPGIMISFLSMTVDELKATRSLKYEGQKLLELLTYCLQFPKSERRLEAIDEIAIPGESACPIEDIDVAKAIVGYKPQIFVSADQEFLEYLKRESVAPQVDILETREALEKYYEKL